MGLLIVVLLGALFHDTLAQSGIGEYYVINGGFHPTALFDPNAAIHYRTGLTGAPYYLITGDYVVRRRVCRLGITMTPVKKSIGSNAFVNSGKKMVFEDLCNMKGFSLDPFRERFTGTIDENCCIDAGNYTLSGWSIEQHLKPSITKMVYGDYMFHLCWMENGDQNNCILENDIQMIFENINKKEAAAKASENKKNGKGKKKKKKEN